MKYTKIIKKSKNKIILDVDMDKNTISKVIREYSKVCEIDDVNVYEEDIDNIIVKLYKEYNI